MLLEPAPQGFGHPALKRPLLGDRHLALHLQQLAGGELGVEGADQLQGLEKHLHGAILDGGLLRGQQLPNQLRVKAGPVGLDLVLRQLAGLPQPAIRVGVKAAPVQERIEINGLSSQLNAVLLKAALQLDVLLDGGRQGLVAGPRWYRNRPGPTSPAAQKPCPKGMVVATWSWYRRRSGPGAQRPLIPTQLCREACW